MLWNQALDADSPKDELIALIVAAAAKAAAAAAEEEALAQAAATAAAEAEAAANAAAAERDGFEWAAQMRQAMSEAATARRAALQERHAATAAAWDARRAVEGHGQPLKAVEHVAARTEFCAKDARAVLEPALSDALRAVGAAALEEETPEALAAALAAALRGQPQEPAEPNLAQRAAVRSLARSPFRSVVGFHLCLVVQVLQPLLARAMQTVAKVWDAEAEGGAVDTLAEALEVAAEAG